MSVEKKAAEDTLLRRRGLQDGGHDALGLPLVSGGKGKTGTHNHAVCFLYSMQEHGF